MSHLGFSTNIIGAFQFHISEDRDVKVDCDLFIQNIRVSLDMPVLLPLN